MIHSVGGGGCCHPFFNKWLNPNNNKVGRSKKGYGNNDYRFYKERVKVDEGTLRQDAWDEVKKFETEEDAHKYWDETEYREMHKVELESGERFIVQFIKTDALYETANDIRMGM